MGYQYLFLPGCRLRRQKLQLKNQTDCKAVIAAETSERAHYLQVMGFLYCCG